MAPDSVIDGMPLKRDSDAEPCTHSVWLKAENGTISPDLLRAYQSFTQFMLPVRPS